MTKLLEGKVALVTGGGRGVGRGIAIALAQAGARVVVNDLGATLNGQASGEQPALEVVAAIRAIGGDAAVDGGSVADWNAAHKMVEGAVERFGRIDIVVNNAGILRDVMFHRMSEAEFDTVVAVHLKGSFNVSRAAAPHFKAQGSGVYVHMSSTSGLIGNFGQANYAAAKLGIAALSKSIALDMAKFKVRSNAVAPFAWTRMIDSIPATTPEQKKRIEGLKKLGAGEGGALRRRVVRRRSQRRDRPDLRRAQQRDLPLQPAAADPQRAPRRRLDARERARDGAADAARRLLWTGPVVRRLHVGSGLDKIYACLRYRTAAWRQTPTASTGSFGSAS